MYMCVHMYVCVHALILVCVCEGGATIFSSLLLHSLQEVPEDSGSSVCGLFRSVTRWCCSVQRCCVQPSSGNQRTVVLLELTVKSRAATK